MDILQVSNVKINIEDNLEENYKLVLNKSSQFSCPRCRRFHSEAEDELCIRCNDIVNNIENIKEIFN